MGISSCYCKMPDCIGFKREGLICCFQTEQAGCKCVDMGDETNSDNKCCTLFEGGAYLVKPSTCCQFTEQFFCLDSRCAFPMTDKVPCMCTICPFMVLFVD